MAIWFVIRREWSGIRTEVVARARRATRVWCPSDQTSDQAVQGANTSFAILTSATMYVEKININNNFPQTLLDSTNLKPWQ